MASGDDVVPREELEALRVENAALQRNFDDFQDGSRELEEELEAELERVNETNLVVNCFENWTRKRDS